MGGGHRRRRADVGLGSRLAGAKPDDLGRRHHRPVRAVAVQPGGRVVTGGDERVLVWDTRRQIVIGQLNVSVSALAARARNSRLTTLAIGSHWDPRVTTRTIASHD
jgi:hypothetical protein